MPSQIQHTNSKEDSQKNNTCKKWVNGFLFLGAAVTVGAVLYYGIRENKRLKREKELLEYEIWG